MLSGTDYFLYRLLLYHQTVKSGDRPHLPNDIGSVTNDSDSHFSPLPYLGFRHWMQGYVPGSGYLAHGTYRNNAVIDADHAHFSSMDQNSS